LSKKVLDQKKSICRISTETDLASLPQVSYFLPPKCLTCRWQIADLLKIWF